MKKENFRPSVAKMLLLMVAVLFLFSQPSFGQDAKKAGEKSADSSATASTEKDDTADQATAVKGDAKKGKELFNTNCAACHKRYKRSTGPALFGVTAVRDRDWIYRWVHNSSEVLASGDEYANGLFKEYNETAMTHFPQLSESDIDDILAYVEQPKPEPAKATPVAGAQNSSGGGGVSANIILGILAFVLVLLIVILALVNKTLNRFAEEKGVKIHEKPKFKPIWKAFVENQFLVLASSIFIFLLGSYVVYGYLMQVGIDQGYQPVQPIHYSHRIHAGDNKIACEYCHYSARVSKSSGIPSLNVCMNCHKAISEVDPKTATKEHSKKYYDGEIAKLYNAVGWDPDEHAYTGETHPVKWVRIHNLPDLVYFNHSQHRMVAGIQCQKCHGEIQEMEVVHQFAPLTMGWCINCHRETEVKMKGNKYYEKIHEQLSKKYGVSTLTEAQMGGLECGRCHY